MAQKRHGLSSASEGKDQPRSECGGSVMIRNSEAGSEIPTSPPERLFVVRVHDLPGRGIEDAGAGMVTMIAVKIEHVVERSRDRVHRATADAAEIPVVFDEAQDRRLVGDCVIDEILLGPGRNDEQRQARAKTAAAVLLAAGHIVRLW